MKGKPIRTDIFEYDRSFRAYKETATENESGWLLNQTFLKSLQDQGLFSRANHSYVVGDIGCGEGDAIISYLQDIDFKGGLQIRAMDNNAYFISDGTRSDDDNPLQDMLPVEKNLTQAKQSQIIPLQDYQIIYGDFAESDIVQAMCTEEEVGQLVHPFDLVYCSHSLYYARQPHKNGRYGITYVLDSIATDLLSNSGIAILFHSCLISDTLSSISYFSRGLTQDLVPSEEDYQTYSVDALVRKSCNELGLTCYDIKYRYGSYFSKNLIKYRDVFKDPNRYHELLDNHDALQDFYRILFIAHRPLENAYANKSLRGWNQLVDNVIDLVEQYGYVPLLPCMQVVLGRQASPELKRKVEVAVDACRNKFSYE